MSIKLKELFYYIFFILMIAAKGIGLDSGDRLYYVLSAIAFVCMVCKLCITKYSLKELTAMGALCLIAFLAYVNSGRLGIVLSILAIIGIKDIKISKVFRLGLIVYGICFTGTVLAAANGVIPNPMVVHEKSGIGEVIRWGMGYSTGNVFHISYFILAVFIVYSLREKYSLRHLFYLFGGNLLVFAFSLSYTGVTVTVFYLLLSLYAVKRKKLNKPERICCQLPLPFCVLFSFIMPFFSTTGIGQKLDAMLQARLSFSYYYLTNQPVTLLGARMKDVPNFWVIMDNGYVFILMTYGIAAFLLFYIGYTVIITRYSRRGGANSELAIIFSFLLYGIMEQFISNVFMNISLLFLGEALFERQDGKEAVKEKEANFIHKIQELGRGYAKKLHKAGKWIGMAGIAGGTICFSFFIMIEKKPDYITVPLTSLNYVNAQSVILHLEKPLENNGDLKAVMNQYQEKITDPLFLDLVFRSMRQDSGAGELDSQINNMTAEKIIGMLELSLPEYVYSSGIYSAFRIRLFEGSPDFTSEAYAAVLKEIVKQMQTQMPKVQPEAVSTEVVGKSFGTDRIEHIRNKELYKIQKKGNLLRIEIIRTGIIRIATGAVTGIMVSAIISGMFLKRSKFTR